MSLAHSGNFKIMDERLDYLIKEVQRHAFQTEEWHLALTQLVDEILRSRKICRSLGGQPLFGVYQEIYEQVQQQLLQATGEQLNQHNPKQMTARTWSINLRDKAFRTTLDDDRLKKLAVEAQRHPLHSELRQYALGELVEAIRLSGRLCHPHRGKFSPHLYDLLYDEAVNKTLVYVCRKIDIYDPDKGEKRKFMNWVNFRLDKSILECWLEFRSLNSMNFPSLKELDDMVQPEEPPSLIEMVLECLEEDAGDIFKQAYIRNRPDVSFWSIALARLHGKSWEEMSENFGIKTPTLSSFFYRNCEKFRPHFQQCMYSK